MLFYIFRGASAASWTYLGCGHRVGKERAKGIFTARRASHATDTRTGEPPGFGLTKPN
jgi:hypothetical protein